MIPSRAQGRALTALAWGLFGVRRRWWGLEPDWLLRRRLLRGFLALGPEHHPAGMPRRSWWQRLTRK